MVEPFNAPMNRIATIWHAGVIVSTADGRQPAWLYQSIAPDPGLPEGSNS